MQSKIQVCLVSLAFGFKQTCQLSRLQRRESHDFLTHGLPTSLFWDNIIFDGTLPKPFGHEVAYPESNPGPLEASFVSVVPSIPWPIRVIKERGILLQEGPQIKQGNI